MWLVQIHYIVEIRKNAVYKEFFDDKIYNI